VNAVAGAGRGAAVADRMAAGPLTERNGLAPDTTNGFVARSFHASRRRRISPGRCEHMLHTLGITGRQWRRWACCSLVEECAWNSWMSERQWLDELLVDIEALRAS
jgi:hypothetical protein